MYGELEQTGTCQASQVTPRRARAGRGIGPAPRRRVPIAAVLVERVEMDLTQTTFSNEIDDAPIVVVVMLLHTHGHDPAVLPRCRGDRLGLVVREA